MYGMQGCLLKLMRVVGMEGRLPGLQRHWPAPLCPSLLTPAHLLEAAGSACTKHPVRELAVDV